MWRTRSTARAGSAISSTKYHIQDWVQRNAPKLITYGQSLGKPALTIGAGALSLLIELATIFILVLLLLLEGPKMRRLDPRPDERRPAPPQPPGFPPR